MKRPAAPRPAASPADSAAAPVDLGALPEWDLGDLYPGMASPEFEADLVAAKAEATALAARYKGKLAALDGAGMATAVRAYEALDERLSRIMSYAQLVHAGDVMDNAIGRFYQATQELGVASNVTSFTMSDFSRTFQPNSNLGSDHAWGSHHIVMGGAVKGGKMYGTFPTLALGGPDDSGSNGRWVPTTGSVQYAATLASWFGVSAAQMATIFPNFGSFLTPNLGFV